MHAVEILVHPLTQALHAWGGGVGDDCGHGLPGIEDTPDTGGSGPLPSTYGKASAHAITFPAVRALTDRPYVATIAAQGTDS